MKLQNLIHILVGIVCVGLLPGAQAVAPAPGRGLSRVHYGRRNQRPSKPHHRRCEHSSWLAFAL